jgi:hypothetical protein
VGGVGGDAGPALAGHTAEQVRRQVRNPIGDRMPRYTSERLGDQELDQLIAFIEGLQGAGGYGHRTDAPSADLANMHARMALVAVKTDSAGEAAHHLRHALESSEDATIRALLESALAAVTAELHDAEHLIEEIVGGHGSAGDSVPALHLVLTLAAIEIGDAADAAHHLAHFSETESDPDRVNLAEDALVHVEGGELEQAEHIIEEIGAGDGHHHE